MRIHFREKWIRIRLRPNEVDQGSIFSDSFSLKDIILKTIFLLEFRSLLFMCIKQKISSKKIHKMYDILIILILVDFYVNLINL